MKTAQSQVRKASYWLMLLIMITWTGRASAQLSPGELAQSHAGLEGMANCVKCHQLGKGLSDRLCLDCHAEIDDGLKNRRGYHYRGIKNTGKACHQCHSDHHGRDFELVHWPGGVERFDHALAGYDLIAGHANLRCRKCHQPKNVVRDPRKLRAGVDLERTYLGLAAGCLGCHDDEHRGQLHQDCTRCHGLEKWKPISKYAHDQGKYRLTGLHLRVACDKCHLPAGDLGRDGGGSGSRPFTRYTGLEFARCTPCHRDKHGNRLGNDCERCHSTTGWKQIDDQRFDHAKTVYPLEGRHKTVACRKCHAVAKMTASLAHQLCTDCHKDVHRAQFTEMADGGRCETCHDLSGFMPPKYDLAEHQRSRYPLNGAHKAVPCGDCHPLEPLRGVEPIRKFRIAETACHDCHQDEHRGQFPHPSGEKWCDSCHNTSGWRAVKIDHDRTRFALAGGHSRTACGKCHKRVETGTDREHTLYRPLELTCIGCHADIHVGQFNQGKVLKNCETCHTAASWKELHFVHNRDSRYSIKGAHENVACAGCHKPDQRSSTGARYVLYRPVNAKCVDCHSGNLEHNYSLVGFEQVEGSRNEIR